MSYWGAIVIINIFHFICLYYFFIGGFNISYFTLYRFLVLHFILSFIYILVVIVHLIYLHWVICINLHGYYISGICTFLYPYFVFKDLIGFLITSLFICICCNFILILSAYNNNLEVNKLFTPYFLLPEWYLLF